MHTILVADDSVTIQRAVEIVFDKEPFTVVKAGSGLEAMKRARESKPHLVLADHTMLDQSGYDLAAALRADPETQSIPVLLLSASSNPFDEARGRAAGVVGHLPKPFDCQTLLDRVRTVLGVAATPPGTFTAAAAPAAPAGVPRPPVGALGGLPRPPGPLGGGVAPSYPARPVPATTPPTAATTPPMAATTPPMAATTPPMAATTPPMAATAAPPMAATTPPMAARPTPVAARELDPFGFGETLSTPPQPASQVPRPAAVAPVAVAASPVAAAPMAFSSPQSMSTPVANAGWQVVAPGAAVGALSSPPPAPVPAAAPAQRPSPVKAGDDLMEISDVDIAEVDSGKATTKVNIDSVNARLQAAPRPTVGLVGEQRLAQAVDVVVAAAAPAIAQASAGAAPAHEALTQEARSIIERIAWEVVPELAELIIREEIQRLLKAK